MKHGWRIPKVHSVKIVKRIIIQVNIYINEQFPLLALSVGRYSMMPPDPQSAQWHENMLDS